MTNTATANTKCNAAELADVAFSEKGVIDQWLRQNKDQIPALKELIEAAELLISFSDDDTKTVSRMAMSVAVMETFLSANFGLVSKLYAHLAVQKLDLERDIENCRAPGLHEPNPPKPIDNRIK